MMDNDLIFFGEEVQRIILRNESIHGETNKNNLKLGYSFPLILNLSQCLE